MFTYFIQFLVAIATSILLAPKQKIQNPKPSNLNDFSFPTAMDRPIPIFWGTIKQPGPNCIWAGDFSNKAVKVKSGNWLTGKTTQIVNYKYNFGFQLALGMGKSGIKLKKIYYDDHIIFENSGATAGRYTIVDKQNLFGGDKSGGGVAGTFEFFDGKSSQAESAYVAAKTGYSTGKLKGLCHIVFENFYLGTADYIKNIAFELSHFPGGTNLTSSIDEGVANIGGDANPAYIALDLLLNPNYGAGVSALVDTASFSAAAEILAEEGCGMSYLWDSTRTYKDVIREIEAHTNGVIRQNNVTGKYEFKLIRNDFVVDNLPIISEVNTKKLVSYNRSNISSLHTEVRVKFNDRNSDYNARTANVKNIGTYYQKGQRSSTIDKEYMGFTNRTNAIRAAARDLIPVSIDLCQVQLECNRTISSLNLGDAVLFKRKDIGLEDGIVMRITSMDVGTNKNGTISIDLMEDYFSFYEKISYEIGGDNGGSTGGGTLDAADLSNVGIIECPTFFAPDARTKKRMFVLGARNLNGGLALGYTLREERVSGYSLGIPTSAKFYDVTATAGGDLFEFTPFATVSATFKPFQTELRVKSNDNLTEIDARSYAEILEGENIAYIASETGDEYIGFTHVTYDAILNEFVLHNCARGLFDTIPRSHQTFVKVWFVTEGAAISAGYENFTLSNYESYSRFKLLTVTPNDKLTDNEATTRSKIWESRYARPIAPGHLRVNGQGPYGFGTLSSEPSPTEVDYYMGGPRTIEIDGSAPDLTITFSRRDHTVQQVLESETEYDQPLSNVKHNIIITNTLTNTVVKTVNNLVGNSYTWDTEVADGGRFTNLKVEVEAVLFDGSTEKSKSLFKSFIRVDSIQAS